jgi:hypothetical protein
VLRARAKIGRVRVVDSGASNRDGCVKAEVEFARARVRAAARVG